MLNEAGHPEVRVKRDLKLAKDDLKWVLPSIF